MGRNRDINEAAEKYKSDGGEFFKLVNDKDIDVVRFLIEDELIFDEDWFVVHEVEIEGKKRWVRCTEEADCYGCKRKGKPMVKLFLQLIAKSDPDKRKLWERGQNFVPQITEAITKYGSLCNRPYEVERQGVAGDTKTKYELFPLDRDNMELRDIAVEKQQLLGPYGEGFVLKLTDREMQDAFDGRFRPERKEDDRGRGDSGRDRGRSDGFGGRSGSGGRGGDSRRDDRGSRSDNRDPRDDRDLRRDEERRESDRSDRDRDRDRDDRGREDDRDRDRDRGDERESSSSRRGGSRVEPKDIF